MTISEIIHVLLAVCVLLEAVLIERLFSRIDDLKGRFSADSKTIGDCKREIDHNKAEVAEMINRAADTIDGLAKQIRDLAGQLEDIAADHENVKKAVDSINDFNTSVNNIMSFDPVESMKKARKKAKTGGSD